MNFEEIEKLQNDGDLSALLNRKPHTIEVSAKGISSEVLSLVQAMSTPTKVGEQAYLLKVDDETHLQGVLALLHREGIQIDSVIPRRESLEDLFLDEIRGQPS